MLKEKIIMKEKEQNVYFIRYFRPSKCGRQIKFMFYKFILHFTLLSQLRQKLYTGGKVQKWMNEFSSVPRLKMVYIDVVAY